MQQDNNKINRLAELVFARLTGQGNQPSLLAQMAPAATAETLLSARGNSEDVYARLQAATG